VSFLTSPSKSTLKSGAFRLDEQKNFDIFELFDSSCQKANRSINLSLSWLVEWTNLAHSDANLLLPYSVLNHRWQKSWPCDLSPIPKVILLDLHRPLSQHNALPTG
jgi:hypothetical protein